MIQEEGKLWKKGYRVVVGIDEAGRGPLAGPVVAAAVFIDKKDFSLLRKNKFVRDSKELTPKKRKEVFEPLIKKVKWGTGIVSEKTIDRINILQATGLAMEKALKDFEKRNKIKADFAILDGIMKIDIEQKQKAVVKADKKVLSCSAASIIAKVTRDRIMVRYDKKYPLYNFKQHKGYGTKEHVRKLKKHGLCPIHRKSFKH
ncbi:MAG: ribonuclease HII [Candidatus Paceibacterota bacterium]|jgi:ribonuclease HII|nr:ribonuclease HII [Candidatus Paceibacterota bacterium]MDD5555570.1 ribonuclease HII [Candidatus Paceibacterota bacterium]